MNQDFCAPHVRVAYPWRLLTPGGSGRVVSFELREASTAV
jgi:hypothetical protein